MEKIKLLEFLRQRHYIWNVIHKEQIRMDCLCGEMGIGISAKDWGHADNLRNRISTLEIEISKLKRSLTNLETVKKES